MDIDLIGWATFALALGTGWLAWETRRIARATRDTVALQAEPYFALKEFRLNFLLVQDAEIGPPRPAIQPTFEFENPGQVRVTFEVETLEVTFGNDTNPDPQYNTRGGVLHPKAIQNFYYSFILPTTPVVAGKQGTIRYRIGYYASIAQIHHLQATIFYFASGVALPNINIEWRYTDGPRYT